ncbi:MAG: hypothetical protein WCB68_16370, partial [Pyrinomonadaceae bacterium]
IGDYRVNMFGGFSALARYTAQEITGQRKTAGGDIQSKSRVDTALMYGRTRLHPSIGFFIDLKTGKTVDGRELYKDGQLDKAAAARDLIMPLSAGDITDAVMHDPLKGSAFVIPALAGADVSVRNAQPASDAQKDYIAILAAHAHETVDTERMTADEASKEIERLKAKAKQ